MPHARKDTVNWYPNHYYHLYNRGARQITIFRERDNYLYVLKKMKSYLRELNLSIVAYVLLPNHYHFLIQQLSEIKAGLFPQRVFNSYSKAYNKKYLHSGTLFEGRYKAKYVDSERYLRHLCCYIHSNPVKDGLVKSLQDWPYCNYLEWIGKRQGTLIDYDFINTFFPEISQYPEHVEGFLERRKLPDDLRYLK